MNTNTTSLYLSNNINQQNMTIVIPVNAPAAFGLFLKDDVTGLKVPVQWGNDVAAQFPSNISVSVQDTGGGQKRVNFNAPQSGSYPGTISGTATYTNSIGVQVTEFKTASHIAVAGTPNAVSEFLEAQ